MSLTPALALAHDGVPPEPHDLWTAWNWDPLIIVALVVPAWLYARGTVAVWQQAGLRRGISTVNVAAFYGGLVTLFMALVSPLDALGFALFSAHMVQHQLLMLCAAPLLLVGRPQIAYLWAVPRGLRRRIGRWWSHASHVWKDWTSGQVAVSIWALHALALWVWHLPSLYQWALQDELVHMLEHVSFFWTGVLFWWIIVRAGQPGRLSQGAAILYIFTMMMQGGILGALMTFSPVPWYAAYADTAYAWGLTPLDDQILAGLMMWIPGTLVYTAAGLSLLALCLRASERRLLRTEQSGASRAR